MESGMSTKPCLCRRRALGVVKLNLKDTIGVIIFVNVVFQVPYEPDTGSSEESGGDAELGQVGPTECDCEPGEPGFAGFTGPKVQPHCITSLAKCSQWPLCFILTLHGLIQNQGQMQVCSCCSFCFPQSDSFSLSLRDPEACRVKPVNQGLKGER